MVFENAFRSHLEHYLIIIHDPQPLAMINHYRKRGPWIWRCHADLSRPKVELWDYLSPFVVKYDAVIFSIREYAQQLKTPQQAAEKLSFTQLGGLKTTFPLPLRSQIPCKGLGEGVWGKDQGPCFLTPSS